MKPSSAVESAAEPHDDLCAVYLNELPVTGASISVFVGTSNETRITASDECAIAIDEAQFSLGQGPRWDAVRTRLPVMVPDTSTAHLRWPGLGTTLTDAGAAAVLVFPLIVGAVDIGVVELYRTVPGPLPDPVLEHARVLAGRTSWILIRRILDDQHRTLTGAEAEARTGLDAGAMDRREVHQATGMILVQADVSAAEALLLLRAYAFAHDQSLREAARAVIERTVTFTPDPGPQL